MVCDCGCSLCIQFCVSEPHSTCSCGHDGRRGVGVGGTSWLVHAKMVTDYGFVDMTRELQCTEINLS